MYSCDCDLNLIMKSQTGFEVISLHPISHPESFVSSFALKLGNWVAGHGDFISKYGCVVGPEVFMSVMLGLVHWTNLSFVGVRGGSELDALVETSSGRVSDLGSLRGLCIYLAPLQVHVSYEGKHFEFSVAGLEGLLDVLFPGRGHYPRPEVESSL